MTPTRRTVLQALASGAAATAAGCSALVPSDEPAVAGVADPPADRTPLGGRVAYLRPSAPEDTLPAGAGDGRAAACLPALTARQRAEARTVGDAVRALGGPVGEVHAAASCQCLDTARLAFGRATVAGWPAPRASDPMAAALREALSTPPAPGTTRVLVGRRDALESVAGVALDPGALAVFRPGDGGGELDMRLGPDDLRRIAATGDPPGPAVASYPIRRGTPEETAVYRIRSGTPGPTVLVVGGVHGDEAAGHRAARRATDWTVDAGTLVVIPEANRPAVEADERGGRDGLDLNRQFPEEGVPEHPLARALWATVLRHDPDAVVDMHTSAGFAARDDGYVGQAVFHSGHPAIARRIERVAAYLNRAVVPPDRPAYEYLVERMNGDPPGMLATKVARDLGVPACIYEVTEQGLDLATQVEWTTAFLRRLLARWGLLERDSGHAEPLRE